MSQEPVKKPRRCNCCKKPQAPRFVVHEVGGKLLCSVCLYGHDDDADGLHELRKRCSCCDNPPHGGFYDLKPLTGLCSRCYDRPNLCKPGGPHRSTSRGDGSPEVHLHSCGGCRRWFFCDCPEGDVSATKQAYCGCNDHDPPQASGLPLHSHICSRCQDQNFRCIVDDEGARPTCSHCRSSTENLIASGSQERSIKKHPRPKGTRPPKQTPNTSKLQHFLDLEQMMRREDAVVAQRAEMANQLINGMQNLNGNGNLNVLEAVNGPQNDWANLQPINWAVAFPRDP